MMSSVDINLDSTAVASYLHFYQGQTLTSTQQGKIESASKLSIHRMGIVTPKEELYH